MNKRTAVVSVLLAALTLVVFWPVVRADFVALDDDLYVWNNPHIRTGLTLENVRWVFAKMYTGFGLPLTWISHMLDVEIFGLQAGGHHLTNLLFHVTNTLLLLLLLRRLTGALWRSALAAALFAVHPLHVEPVAWISSRKDMLSTCLMLASLALYLRYLRRPGPRRYAAMALVFALGLLSKPMLVTFPLLLLILDWWPLGRFGRGEGRRAGSSTAALVREKVPLLLLSAAAAAAFVFYQRTTGSLHSVEKVPLLYRLVDLCTSYPFYLRKMLLPAGLAVHYPREADPSLPLVALSGLLVIAATWLFLRWGGRRPYLAAGWLWYLVTLFPNSGVVPVGISALADRFAYVPLAGIFLALAWAAGERAGRRPAVVKVLAAAAVVWVSVLAWAASLQVGVWRDSKTLFEHALKQTGSNRVTHLYLGMVAQRQGKMGEAISHFAKALEADPDYYVAGNLLGVALLLQGRTDEARDRFAEVVRQAPGFPDARVNLGEILIKEGNLSRAMEQFRAAVDADPGFSKARLLLADLLLKAGQKEEAAAQLAVAVELDPSSWRAGYDLAVVLADLGRAGEAEAHYRESLRLNPGQANARNNLGVLLAKAGRLDEAMLELEEAVRLQPGFDQARANLEKVRRLRQEGKRRL